MAVKKIFTGLNTHLYLFNLNEKGKFNKLKDKLKNTGKITEVFINNKLAFEHKKFTKR